MSFDSSRFTFHPRKNFLGVVMQQGRVQLDSDWNEWQSEFSRRIQAGTVDTLGQAVYPATTPNAFKISLSTDSSGVNHISIGAGRYYVDGLLAENHGPESQAAWDTALAEMSGSPIDSVTTASTDYTQQPYLPGATLPAGNGPFLAYLDVWQRDITYLEDSHLIDPAVGVDTTGRLQTVWQVKLLDVSSVSGASCSTDFPTFDALLIPPAGQLTNGLVPSASSGPCCLAPNAGYTGQENQLYRVEIHNPGTVSPPPAGGYTFPLPPNTPTFKWSRENASVASAVSAISPITVSGSSVSQLTVASLGRDQVLGFAVNDWIEITDDAHELNGQPGEIYQITKITPSSMTITLSGAVSSAFPLTGGQTNPKLHTRIIKWNQSGQISSTDTSGNLTPWINLGLANSAGLIPVPPAGTTLVLENGITVAFGLNPTTGSFNTGDYWNFAARAADGTIQQLTSAAPSGIHHHYAQLSVITFPSSAPDCRVEWPPSASGCCGCTVDVGPDDITGNTTLQSIFDKFQNQTTGATICLAPGTYSLPSPIRLSSTYTNINLEACQPGTVIIQAVPGNEGNFIDGLFVLDNSGAITFSGIELVVPAAPFTATTFAGMSVSSLDPDVVAILQNFTASIGIRMVNATDVTIKNCAFRLVSRFKQTNPVGTVNENALSFGAGIFASGQNDGFVLQGNQFIGEGDFIAGVLVAPAVNFTTITIQEVPAAPTGLTATTEEAKTATQPKSVPNTTPRSKSTPPGPKSSPAKAASVKAASAKPAALQTRAQEAAGGPAGALSNAGSGVAVSSGILHNFFGTGTSITNLASNGGTVLASTLDQAVITDNTFTRLTVAVLVLGESGNVEFLANEALACDAGFWLVNLTQAQYLLVLAENEILIGSSIAMGYPLPQGDTSSSDMVTVSVPPGSIRIYPGGSNYTDTNSNVWSPDAGATGVTISPPSGNGDWTYTTTAQINATSDPTLYQSERAGPSFSYTFTNLPAGFYTVTLKFAEIFYQQAQKRAFDVSINGAQVITDLDIVADAGGPDTADDKIFRNIPSVNGEIILQFTGAALYPDQNAKIDATEIDPQWSGNPSLGSSESELSNFYDQLFQIAQQGYANLDFSSAQLRIENNEMHYVSSGAVTILDDDSVYNQNSGSLMMIGNRLDNFVVNRLITHAEQTAPGQAGPASKVAPTKTQAKTTAPAQQAQAKAAAAKPKVVEKQITGGTVGPTLSQFVGTSITTNKGFNYLVEILQVSRCVMTSNMLTTAGANGDFSPCLVFDDLPVQRAEIAIMSNVFTGRVLISPERNLSYGSTLPFDVTTWAFLNTIIV